MEDFRVYYDKENYVRNVVPSKFYEQGYIDGFDFFYIIIWKAERAKSKINDRLLKLKNNASVDSICKELTKRIFDAPSPEERLKILYKDYKFLLPTASAILSILYPNEFSVYDYRACDILNGFKGLANLSNFERDFEKLWNGYKEYLQAVRDFDKTMETFTEADRNLWGKSFHDALRNDIKTGFARPNTKKAVGN